MNASNSETENLVTRIMNEGPIGAVAAARAFPPTRAGRPTHAGTVARWVVKGTKREDGVRVYLEGIRVNGKLMTSHAAIRRFIVSQQPEPNPDQQPARTPVQRERAATAAERELVEMGA